MTTALTQFSDALAETVASASPSVVRIEGRDRLPATGFVWTTDGIVITAHHVLERDDNIAVGFPDGETVKATLVGRDPTTDLAALRIPGGKLPESAWADTGGMRVGHLVLALGRPGNNAQATMGIIGALGKSWRTPAGGAVDRYLQTDLVMPPGFSGGPLVDAGGKIIGLNTSALLRGVSISVPLLTIRRVVDTLLAHGRVRRGYIGVGSQPTRLPEALASQLGQQAGLLLVSVESGGPAEKAGLFLGDTIVALAGEPVRGLDDLWAGLSAEKIGDSLEINIVRGGQPHTLTVVPGERPPG